ncbi:MAG: dipeptide epimerase [Gammaproteobacteria bacterium]
MRTNTKSALSLQVETESWPLKEPFRISGYTFTKFDVIVVTLREGKATGRGEAAGVYYHKETPASMTAQIEAVRSAVESGASRQDLLQLLPAGGARNALDCAMWDIEAKRTGRRVSVLADITAPQPLLTVYTLGANDPAHMAEGARRFSTARALKLKLTGEPLDAERIHAVRAARPDALITVDANQGFTRETFLRLLPMLIGAQVALVEQPFPVGHESELDGLDSPIQIAADESVQDRSGLDQLVGRFNVVNIKLDKCGGLTEALAMAKKARQLGLELMVGNMGGTSLAMAPGFVLGQLCETVDLDGPIPLKSDRSPGATYENGHIWCSSAVWGAQDQEMV